MRNLDHRASFARIVAARRCRTPSAEQLRGGALVLAAIGAVLLGPPALRAQEQRDTAPEVVPIRFDWPVGLEAEVTAIRQREREVEGETSGYDIRSEYRIAVSEHEAGLLVTVSDFKTLELSAEPAFTDLFALAMSEISGISPNYIVSREGELLQLVGLSVIVSGGRALLGPMLDSLKTLSAEPALFVESMLSESYVMSQTAEEWNAAVGLWLDADLEIGAVYVHEDGEPSPLLTDVPIPFYHEFTLTEYTPCHESAAPRSCVVLEMVSFPVADAVNDVLSAMVQKISGPEMVGQYFFEEVVVENTVRLVTEPATLIPHRVELVESFRGTMVGPDGEGWKIRQVERRSFQYRYADR